MDKEVLIHVKGLHMIDSQGEEEPVEIIVPGEYYSATEATIFVMRKLWRIPGNLPLIT